MKHMIFPASLALALTLSCNSAPGPEEVITGAKAESGQDSPRGPRILTLEFDVRPDSQAPRSGRVEMVLNIDGKYHINSNQPGSEFLIPTAVKLQSSPELEAGPVEYPPGAMKKFEFSDEELSVYDGRVAFRIPYRAAAGSTGNLRMRGTLTYQACTEKACLPPRNENFEVDLPGGN